MTTVSDLIKKIRASSELQLKLEYVHPLIYVVCISDSFADTPSENRAARLSLLIDLAQSEIVGLSSRGTVQLLMVTHSEFETDYSFLTDVSSGKHWLDWFSHRAIKDDVSSESDSETHQVVNAPEAVRALHFYGLKGGQARTTVLLLFAKMLADSGLKVLVVDADIEAPSLDAMLDVAAEDPESTLLGLAGWADGFNPIGKVYVGEASEGQVDLLACRPKSESFDIDFASFLLSTTLDARVLQSAAEKLRSYATQLNYQYVLIDHRTGLAPSVLPLMEGWPGSAVIFSRPDGMSRNLESAISALLGRDSRAPGAFITFSLDPKDTPSILIKREGRFVEGLLERLSDAMSHGEGDIDPLELERYWMLWCHDPSVLEQTSPSPTQILIKNREALGQLREILGIGINAANSDEINLTKSGATDGGAFILTPDFARLFSLDSNILYVFGRKGTGKTRLLRELHKNNLGFPLLVAQDYDEGGIQSGLALFNSLLLKCSEDYEAFWRALFRIGISCFNKNDKDLKLEAKRVAEMGQSDFVEYSNLSLVEEVLQSHDVGKMVFLLDGIETAVPASKLRSFVEGLFRFMASVQFSRPISSKATVRLFIRSDLHRAASQNVEQQIEGRSINLLWDRQSILNFAVARMASLAWFRREFSTVCSEIDNKLKIISRGALEGSMAEDILLKVFPDGLDRNKIKTTTFLATYFSDAGGDSELRASFYPRLFDGFLREIDKRASADSGNVNIVNDRLKSSLVLNCYDDASREFLDEVRAELINLLDLDVDQSRNQSLVNRFIDSFDGLKTPFVVDAFIGELSDRAQLSQDKVRESLIRMKRLGVFEDRPGYPGSWRTGRLYKAGLKMKYVRARSAK